MIKKIRNVIKRYKLSNLNFRLILYVLAVTFIGIFCIGSAAEGENYQLKQIFGLILGIIVLTFFSLLSYKFLFKFYWVIYLSLIHIWYRKGESNTDFVYSGTGKTNVQNPVS